MMKSSTKVSEDLRSLLAERYGDALLPEGLSNLPLSPVLASLLAHRSVRSFSSTPLATGVLEALVAAAQSASSSSNLQTWSVIAVTDPERKRALSALAGDQQHIIDAPLFLVWIADLARLHDAAAVRDITANGVDYLELFLVGCIDAALAAQNAAVCAEELGHGIVYIGGLRNQPLEVAHLLGLPQRTFAVFGMCVGLPDPQKPAAIKPRLEQRAVLHYDTYDSSSMRKAVTHYEKAMTRFYASQNMVRAPWAVHSGRRVRGPEALSGRHLLKTALRALGFPLR